MGIDMNVWAVLPTEIMAIPSAHDAAEHFSICQLQPDDGHNLGRTIRCLFSSYLC